MGLDQYASAVSKRSVGKNEFDFDLSERVKQEELVWWRNHWYLYDWMAKLYFKKGGRKRDLERSAYYIRIYEQDLNEFEQEIQEVQKRKALYGYTLGHAVNQDRPKGSPDHEFMNICFTRDQEFLKKARQAISDGKAVIYHDSR